MGAKLFHILIFLSYFSLESLHNGLNVETTSWWRWRTVTSCFTLKGSNILSGGGLVRLLLLVLLLLLSFFKFIISLWHFDVVRQLPVKFHYVPQVFLQDKVPLMHCSLIFILPRIPCSFFLNPKSPLQNLGCPFAFKSNSIFWRVFGETSWRNTTSWAQITAENLTLSAILTEFLRSHEQVEQGGILLNYPPFDRKLLGNFTSAEH